MDLLSGLVVLASSQMIAGRLGLPGPSFSASFVGSFGTHPDVGAILMASAVLLCLFWLGDSQGYGVAWIVGFSAGLVVWSQTASDQ